VSIEYFKSYHSYIEAMEQLNDAERGRLYMACLIYSRSGEVTELRGNERFIFPSMKSQIDRDIESYTIKCEVNSQNASLGGQATASKRQRTLANGIENDKTKVKEKEKIKDKAKEKERDAPARQKEYGVYKWVKLADEECARLLADLGQSELDRCIAYIDESAQGTGNKNGWKDWNLTIRRCSRGGWGIKTAQKKGYTAPKKEPSAEEQIKEFERMVKYRDELRALPDE
jgi:hypothetical protein